MKTFLPVLAISIALPLTAYAAETKGNSPRLHKGQAAQACPPGLAKKNPACVPPGLANKHAEYVGKRLMGDYILITTPERYGLDPRHKYYRQDGYVFRVDHDTMKVLNLIGAVSAILD